MSDWKIEKRGFDEFVVNIKKLSAANLLEPAMSEALDVVRQEAMKFPPAPPRPPAGTNTWIRERGQFSRSTFVTAKGAARKRPNVRAGKMYRASEKMLEKWKLAKPIISATEKVVTGKIINAASYAVYVQGEEQSRVMKKIGWKTTKEIINAQRSRIQEVFDKALQKALGAK